MKRMMALVLCAVLAAPACATSRGPRMQTAPQARMSSKDGAVLSDFARQLPLGTRVRAKSADNRTVNGTLLKVTDQAIVIQPRTRVAEALVEVPFTELTALELESGEGGVNGRAIAYGALAGAGAAVGTILLLVLILGGD